MGPQATPVGQIFRYTLHGDRSLRELRALQDFVVERRLRAVQGVADVVTFGGFERQYQVRIDLGAAGQRGRVGGRGAPRAGPHQRQRRRRLRRHRRAGVRGARPRGGDVAGRPRAGGGARGERGAGARARRGDAGRGLDAAARRRRPRTDRRGGRGHRPAAPRREPRHGADGPARAGRGSSTREILPRGVRIEPIYDRSLAWSTRRSTPSTTTSLNGVLLILAVWCACSSAAWRGLLIVAVVVPLSLLTAFIGLRWMGLPANLISMGAIDFGILVDGAIVVLEATSSTRSTTSRSATKRDGDRGRRPARWPARSRWRC